ncbi:hypothetical protein CRYUN_Cryun28dG0052100 [Craigia yunnanensis]
MELDQTEEREDFDRLHLLLPGRQKKLITSIARVAKSLLFLRKAQYMFQCRLETARYLVSTVTKTPMTDMRMHLNHLQATLATLKDSTKAQRFLTSALGSATEIIFTNSSLLPKETSTLISIQAPNCVRRGSSQSKLESKTLERWKAFKGGKQESQERIDRIPECESEGRRKG